MKEQPYKKEKQFLKAPEYPGGKKALLDFINANLKYPEDAFKNEIQGVVSIAYEVNDNGEVESAKIVKALSPSCNEEALRLVHLLKYGKAYNHGVRVKSNHKINIHFRLPQKQMLSMQISYSQSDITVEKPVQPKVKEEYSYTIHL